MVLFSAVPITTVWGVPVIVHDCISCKGLKSKCIPYSMGGDMAQEVRAVVRQSEGCRFDPTLGVSKCPWARHLTPQLLLTSWLVPCMAANRRWCVNVCANGWKRGINCKALWIKALYKCQSIYHLYLHALHILPPLCWAFLLFDYPCLT